MTLALLLQTAPAPSGGGSVFTPLIFQFGLIFLIFYFIIIRPQQKQRKRHEEMLRTMKRGDRIVTAGGIIGEVIHVKEGVKDGAPSPSMDDEITIKTGESRIIIERGRVAKIVSATGSSTAPDKAANDAR